MKFFQIIRTTWLNILGKRMRSLLTVIGIAVGIGTIVFLVSLGYGLQEFSVKRISSIQSLTTLDVTQGKTANFKLDEPTIDKISKLSNVSEISPIISLGSKVALADKKTDAVATAVQGDYFVYEDLKLTKGSTFMDDDKKAVLSTALLQALGTDENSIIGKTIAFNISYKQKEQSQSKDLSLIVSGVVSDNTSPFAYIPLSQVQDLLGERAIYSSLKVKTASEDTMGGVRKEIEDMGLSVTSVADTIAQVNSVFGGIRIALGLLGGIALVVAAIGMFNTMTIALLERTRDIGIMKSVGVDNRDIYWMFLAEAIIISGAGGIAGAAFGQLLAVLINVLVGSLARMVGAEPIVLFSTPFTFVAIIVGFSLVVGISTGFYPSRRAAKINPLDALRYE
ncbi:MAG: ABC transporter permease [Patescibacteria group bacterium]